MRWILIIGGAVVGLVAAVALMGLMLPKGHTASKWAAFGQPPDVIWAALADHAGAASWRTDVKQVEMLERRNGRAVWRETWKSGDKILFEEVEALAPRRMVTRIADPKLPFGGTWTIEVTPKDGTTAVKITEDGEVYNPIFRFISHFFMNKTATIEAFLKALGGKFGQQVEMRS
jgi:hypothetical protein